MVLFSMRSGFEIELKSQILAPDLDAGKDVFLTHALDHVESAL
jgi:hypothetical protein